MSRDEQAPVWPGDGVAFAWDDERGGQWKHPSRPLSVMEPGPNDEWVPASGMGGILTGPTPQAAVDALHARLQEQHAALGTVLGVRTAEQERADVVAYLMEIVKQAGVSRTGDYVQEQAANLVDICVSAIERGDHVGSASKGDGDAE